MCQLMHHGLDLIGLLQKRCGVNGETRTGY